MSFEKFYGDHSTTTYEPAEGTTTYSTTRTVRMDVYESAKKYYMRLSIPGVKRDNLYIQFKNENDLEISGHVESDHPQHINEMLAREIFAGPFYRLIRFPETTDSGSIKFDYHNGILEIYIDKTENEDR